MIASDENIAEMVVRASLNSPIMLSGFPVNLVDKLLPVIKEGRFILSPNTNDDEDFKYFLKQVGRYR